MNIKQLAKRIDRELLPDEEGLRLLTITRDGIDESAPQLRRQTMDTLSDFVERLNRAIPDDFEYVLAFEDGNADISISYSDGERDVAGFSQPLDLRQDTLQVAAELRVNNWNECRLHSIKGANFHDEIGDLADNYPAKWISSAEIQETYREQIESYERWLIEAGQSSGVLAGNTEERVLMNCTVERPDERDGWISTQIGQGHLILAVIENGVLLSAEDTDALRRVQLEKLPRIAKAKAEGRFQQALQARGGFQF